MTVTSLGGLRRRDDAPTVALVGTRCWVADAVAASLAAAGDRVVRLGDGEDGAAGSTGCGADVVVHVAPGPRELSLRGQSEPTLQTLAALHAARADSARLVIASLPGNAAHLPATEGLAQGFRSAHDVRAVVVRVAECYGPGMPPSRSGTLARMLEQARAQGEVVVEAGDEDEHPVCFVDDVVAGLLRVVHDEGTGPFRLGPDTPTSTLSLARAVAAATGTTCRVRERRRLRVAPATPRGQQVQEQVPAGWRPQVDLADGLARCLQVPVPGAACPPDVRSVVDLRAPVVSRGGDVA